MMFSHRDSTSDDAYKPDGDQESAEISFSDMIFSSIMTRLGKYPVIQKLERGATIRKNLDFCASLRFHIFSCIFFRLSTYVNVV